ncbi:6-phosphogluconolactonase [Chachezhania sediminis]|uniref:6-phosphogluconolactonase n=1 Tax=Chachezhania sediminis TaxID=2599291 RepID=UPI00131D2F5A|nr:6-phosphogluconolactonase [Chachezhania sediminis]
MDLRIAPDRETAVARLADEMAAALHLAISTEGRATLAVAGGTTPGPVFDRLSTAGIAWPRVTVMPTDERWVPEDDPRSNAGLIRDRLLIGPASVARYQSLYAPSPAPESVLPRLSAEVAGVLPVSVMLLGMGADMHTASLFPGAPGLANALAADAPAVVAVRPADQPEVRVSLSAPVLRGARALHILIYGDDKRAALERASDLSPEQAPVRIVLDKAIVHWAP